MRFPLRGSRVTLRPLAAEDVDAFVAYRRDPEVARFQSWESDYALTDGSALAERQRAADAWPAPGEWLQLAVHAADGGGLLGDVAVHSLDGQPGCYELGVTFARHAQGRGYATEALGVVIDALFADGAHRIHAECDARNLAVQRTLERAGMRREASLVEADWFKAEWTTLEVWAMLDREHAARREGAS